MNCRLPQTPRTPRAGLSHYFDDILHRQVGNHGAHTPKSPNLSPGAPRLRRSSTSRSLAARSDYSADANGYDDGGQGGESGDVTPGRRGSVTRGGLMLSDLQRAKARAEADAHLHEYITQQLERVRLERGEAGWVEGDEFEAQV